MNFKDYQSAINAIKIGKNLPSSIYLHESALGLLPEKIAVLVVETIDQFKILDESWNLIKFYKRDYKIAFLDYPLFEEDSYPTLHQSQLVDLHQKSIRKSDYSKSFNPPILHRKETFVSSSYPLITLFERITTEGEAIGLYENTKRIGFKNNWESLIKSKGFYLNNLGRLEPISSHPLNPSTLGGFDGNIERHKTAINRNQLSHPMQVLARHHYLNGEFSVFDYGCGKGDDIRELEAHGIDVSGWDPVYRPNERNSSKDIVNLGFVLNVIEDRNERTQTLFNAWRYVDKFLVVSVMIANEHHIQQFMPYKDGVITTRKTFQKYYSQGEIRYYIESTLNETAIAAGQGVFIIFKDKLEEQAFLSERQHIKRNWQQKTQRELRNKTKSIKQSIIEKNIELFTDFWNTSLELGRIPANNEFEFSDQIRHICGSHIKAQAALLKYFGEHIFQEAKEKRREDLIVYFALGLFEKRKAHSNMPESLKRDLKAFFPSYKYALEEAREILFSVGNSATLNSACITAYEKLKSGILEESHSYTFHRKKLGELPAELRIYVGCATQLYGDIVNIHLIKAHIRSGKVSLMRYDDWGKEQPILQERIKIKLRELDIDFFDYSIQNRSSNIDEDHHLTKSIFE